MALQGLLALVCAGAIVAADPAPSAPLRPDSPDADVARALAVQTAWQEGREQLLHGEYHAAVTTLESQLAYIGGNRRYLKLLQDAYRGYVRELRLAKQEAEARRYLRRLQILDKGAVLDMASAPLAAETNKTAAASAVTPTVRMKSEEDAFAAINARSSGQGRAFLEQADQAFGKRPYAEARELYEKADQAHQEIAGASRDRWAYSKLYAVVEQLNKNATTSVSWNGLEQEVRAAVRLSPRLESYSSSLLDEIQKRRGVVRAASADSEPANPRVAAADGWSMVESANFRVFHKQENALAGRVLQVAEQTRTRMQQKWFGASNETWDPKCDIYLHPTAQDYTRATGQANSPGHSYVRKEARRAIVRLIELHTDEADLLAAILPHEATHVVLLSEFGLQMLPRWADEGMAVLSEPAERVARHRANLARCQQDNQLLPVKDLLQLDQYPSPRFIRAFYAESVSVVEYLVNQRGPTEFTLFLQDALRYGYDRALQRHYGLQGMSDLEARWSQTALRGSGAGQFARSTP